MRLWRTVVGKLWMTIILLVVVVLTILTFLLQQFFETYHVDQIEQDLSHTAEKISTIVKEHPSNNIGKEIALTLLDEHAKVIIAYENKQIFYLSDKQSHEGISYRTILDDKDLEKVFTSKKAIKKELIPRKTLSQSRYQHVIVTAVPVKMGNGKMGAVFVYQSLEVLKEMTQQTTKLILLAAGIAIILTTGFAFFLSTRIAGPLHKMREAAFEVANGHFDKKVPILTRDEIGELAMAFNTMGRQLTFNMNALKQEKEQLRSILSSMADGVVTFNRDGTILITNPPAEQFLQQWYHGQGKHENLSIPTDLSDLLQKVIDTEKEQNDQFEINGRYYVMIGSPLYDQSTVRGVVIVIRDMTEERKLNKLRDDFIANVSHELRTPIAMLQGYSEAIIDDIAATEAEKQEFAKIIYDETLRIGRLVNELLDLARMEAGHFSFHMDIVQINQFIVRVTNKFNGIAKDKGIQLSCFTTERSLAIEMDVDRIEQVLTNLIDNAIRHTSPNGFVKVIEEEREDGVAIHVQDNGSGIPPEDLPFVFERFYKADKARTRGKSGTGLGLAIAKNIVKAHKGKITVKSEIGQGTTFSFFLPKKQHFDEE
ncbi:ATP-binding protein [Heyndrickxia ginsengihumi]|uniref:histidine kinase n=1 Tax=Heyndrickxia ginsengihumi TaxID=363870 RepID=A0A6M0P7L5_9BACI|nr:ATP-binding protein [Heyndrickxia ginsengihumi]MBE6184621.1 cell wall metabolism sensor histidine kinase WalK [Bacillus sp. (in: firmicutes)]MCM3022888.1 cell wall metabolism sensor histidine kinase WalK [Heyndrickxia ginsengihumi]NEY20684.1 cell wall metabolism sensor histidine kinase WalK [Heyndrickxia ginsengihumi]